MKNMLFIYALLATAPALAQFNVHVVEVTANDLVYDANTDKLYVSIPSTNGANGNSIGVINPNTYQLENTTFIGSEPTVMAITDNGQYIYVGFAGSSTARRYNVADQTAGLQFPLGSDPITGALYVEDIETLPGNPNAVAISRMNNGFSPRHEGVAIYDNGVARPLTTQDHTGSNRIEFATPSSMIGYNNETTEFGLRRISVSAGGCNEVSVSQNILSGFFLDFIYHNNFVYGTDGTIIDMSLSPFVAGHFNGGYGPLVYDAVNDLVCFVSTDNGGVIAFKRFDPNNFLLYDGMPISEAFGYAFNVVTCGPNCFAFNTEDNKVVILDLTASQTGEATAGSLRPCLYPNPAKEVFSVNPAYTRQFVRAEVVGLDGKLLKTISLDGANLSCDISDLQDGMYLVRLTESSGMVETTKLVKH